MIYSRIETDEAIRRIGSVRLDCARFKGVGSAEESFAFLHVTDPMLPYSQQADALFQLLKHWMMERNSSQTSVFVRFFVSDASNQEADVAHRWQELGSKAALSIIQQPPMDGTKVAAWVYAVSGAQLHVSGPMVAARIGDYTHYWYTNKTLPMSDSLTQTGGILEAYEQALSAVKCNLPAHCVRTWFFVQNVDVNYHGVVVGRRENFARIGLTEKTHYIASTGIEGRSADPKALVKMDAYAVAGLQPNQQQYLYAPDYLNPTHEYGVTFERGVKVKYGDRGHLFISGTASINNKGEVVHVGDIRKQTERMWTNVEQLLKEGGASFNDVAQMFVYIRDVADYQVVNDLFEERFPMIPKVILLAPVCRPAWLIEMECVAVVKEINTEFATF